MKVLLTGTWLVLAFCGMAWAAQSFDGVDVGLPGLEVRPIEEAFALPTPCEPLTEEVGTGLWHPYLHDQPNHRVAGVRPVMTCDRKGPVGPLDDGCPHPEPAPAVTVPAPGLIALLVLSIAIVGRRRVF
jgi:hypothetical protein